MEKMQADPHPFSFREKFAICISTGEEDFCVKSGRKLQKDAKRDMKNDRAAQV